MNIKYVQYTKANGERNLRQIIVVSSPRENYLVYDVTNLSDEHIDILELALTEADKQRDNAMKDFELLTGIKQNSLWRSFKPEGIEWEDEDGNSRQSKGN